MAQTIILCYEFVQMRSALLTCMWTTTVTCHQLISLNDSPMICQRLLRVGKLLS